MKKSGHDIVGRMNFVFFFTHLKWPSWQATSLHIRLGASNTTTGLWFTGEKGLICVYYEYSELFLPCNL